MPSVGHWRRNVAVAAVVLGISAPAAFAGAAYVRVSAKYVVPGQHIRVYGSVDHGCQVGRSGDVATIYSKAFASKHKFAGIPAVNATLNKRGHFSVRVQLSRRAGEGTFTVSGRCGGGRFASTKLTIVGSAY
jgi:hypothetical protein